MEIVCLWQWGKHESFLSLAWKWQKAKTGQPAALIVGTRRPPQSLGESCERLNRPGHFQSSPWLLPEGSPPGQLETKKVASRSKMHHLWQRKKCSQVLLKKVFCRGGFEQFRKLLESIIFTHPKHFPNARNWPQRESVKTRTSWSLFTSPPYRLWQGEKPSDYSLGRRNPEHWEAHGLGRGRGWGLSFYKHCQSSATPSQRRFTDLPLNQLRTFKDWTFWFLNSDCF